MDGTTLYKDVVDLASNFGTSTLLYVAGWIVCGTKKQDRMEIQLRKLNGNN